MYVSLIRKVFVLVVAAMLLGISGAAIGQSSIERNHAGSWFDPAAPGHGLNFQLLPSRVGLLYWYTYDQSGRPIFLYGQTRDPIPINATSVVFETFYLEGMRFPTFNPISLQRARWGEMTMSFDGCARASLFFLGGNLAQMQNAPTGTGTIQLVKLADQDGVECSADGAVSGIWSGQVLRNGLSSDAFLLMSSDGLSALIEPNSDRAGTGTWRVDSNKVLGEWGVCLTGQSCVDERIEMALKPQLSLIGPIRRGQIPSGSIALRRDPSNYLQIQGGDLTGRYSNLKGYSATILSGGGFQFSLSGDCRLSGALNQPILGKNIFKIEGAASGCSQGSTFSGLAFGSDRATPGAQSELLLAVRLGQRTVLGAALSREAERLTPSNVVDTQSLSYPLAFVSGSVTGFPERVQVTNLATGQTAEWPIVAGRYKALILLKEGKNNIEFDFGGRKQQLTLSFVPDSLPVKRVRLIYYLAADGTGELDGPPGSDRSVQTAVKRMQTGALLLQTFFAESYRSSRERQTGVPGLPRKTFHFAKVDGGLPVVEIVRSTRLRQQILGENNDNSQFGEIVDRLYSLDRQAGRVPDDFAYMVRSGIATLDSVTGIYRGGICLGSGGLMGAGVGVCHGANLVTHASSVSTVPWHFLDDTPIDSRYIVDDSRALRNYFGSYSATLGGLLHEFGHALSLPHTNTGVMASDFSYINRFFSLTEVQPDGSNLVITRMNELPYPQEVDWWHPDSVRILETSPFIR